MDDLPNQDEVSKNQDLVTAGGSRPYQYVGDKKNLRPKMSLENAGRLLLGIKNLSPIAVPSGKRLRSYDNITIFNGKIHYFYGHFQ